MKRLFVALTLVAVFAAASFAAVKDFGAFTVDVLDGWTASQDGPTAIIVKNDNTASVTITIDSTQGYALDALAAGFVDTFKNGGQFKSVSDPEKDSDGDYTFTMVNNQDVESKVLLSENEGKYLLLVMTGDDEGIGTMLGTIEDK